MKEKNEEKERQPLILASSSPRRRRFLEDMGISFRLAPVDIDESVYAGENARNYVERVALQKWQTARQLHHDCWILTADTTVSLHGRILGKPKNEADAFSMLMQLNGNTHTVITSFVLGDGHGVEQETVSTEVTFSRVSEHALRSYIATGECLDKAGAYAIQGKGASLVLSLSGSYSNVVGLPVAELRQLFEKHGILN